MNKIDLTEFLRSRMSMANVYQPLIIKELLMHNGQRTKAELAASLAAHDIAVQEYYERVVMRWPKTTLTKHRIIDYDRRVSLFRLLPYPYDVGKRHEAIGICDEAIRSWIERKRNRENSSGAGASMRYEVLKKANGKCQLCGIPAEVRPIDIDHIVPRSRADKNGKVRLNGQLIHVNDRQNLQALCFSCNRAKRDEDQTDFRRREKLVRDRIPEIIRASGRSPNIAALKGKELRVALLNKLSEEHAEFLQAKTASDKLEELVDLIEVALAIGTQYGAGEEQVLALLKEKRAERGGFSKGYLYRGDL